MLYKTYNYPMQNIKHYYCNVSNVNYWIISVSEKMEEVIKRQASRIRKSVFVFYRKSSTNRAQKKIKKKFKIK